MKSKHIQRWISFQWINVRLFQDVKVQNGVPGPNECDQFQRPLAAADKRVLVRDM